METFGSGLHTACVSGIFAMGGYSELGHSCLSSTDYNLHWFFRSIFTIILGFKGRSTNAIFYELWASNEDRNLYGGSSTITYITVLGKMLTHDGGVLQRLIDYQEKRGVRQLKIAHVNHANDKTVGLQRKKSRTIHEVGYMSSGEILKLNDQVIRFNCFFSQRKKESGPPDDNYSKNTDELPYPHESMLLDNDSEELISHDKSAGSQNNHSGHILSKHWTDSMQIGFAAKAMRLKLILRHILELGFTDKEASFCTREKPVVTVSKGGELGTNGDTIMKYVYDVEVAADEDQVPFAVPLQKDWANIEKQLVICNWQGQDDEIYGAPQYMNNVEPKEGIEKSKQEQINLCYLEG